MLSYWNPLPSLLNYTGPFQVGPFEFEIPVQSLLLECEEAPVETIKFRLFYPTDKSASTSYGIPWLPEPQTLYLEAYLRLARVRPWILGIIRAMSWLFTLITIPAHRNTPLSHSEGPLKAMIFSHGVLGGINTHNTILGELASYGLVCVAVEHRDGSAPLSIVKSSNGNKDGAFQTSANSTYFKPTSFEVRPDTLKKRDEQMQIRLFELAATFSALELLNTGSQPSNLADNADFAVSRNQLDLKPGAVIWGGHSFGGTTMVQFLKTVHYRERVETLLRLTPSRTLIEQITPTSPLILLDPWFMPFKSPAAKVLLTRPLPCFATSSISNATVLALLSSEFAWHWPEAHSHVPAILSADPVSVEIQTQKDHEADLAKYKSPRHFISESKRDELRAATLLAKMKDVASPYVGAYVFHDTTHSTFTDFGILFSWLSYWLTGQKDASLAVQNTARLILKVAGIGRSMNEKSADEDAARKQVQKICWHQDIL